jgi:hypothetical protein
MKCNLLSRFTPVLRKVAAVAVLPFLTATAFAAAHHEPLPNYDKRAGKVAQPNAARKAAMAKVAKKVQTAKVSEDPLIGGPAHVASTTEFLTGKNGRGKAVSAAVADSIPDNDAHKPAKAFVKEHSAMFGFGPEALDAAKVNKDYMTKVGNFRTVIWQQHIDDIPVFNAIFKAHWTADGELINVGTKFVPDLAKASTKVNNRKGLQANPPVSAKEAIVIAAKNIGDVLTTADITENDQPTGNAKNQHFRGGKVLNEAEAHLTWLPMDDSTVQLCWEVMVVSRARGEGYEILVDAKTGEVLVRQCLTEYLTPVTYRVFTNESPTPMFTGWSSPITNQPPLVARSLVTLSALSTDASPNGWINDGDNTTIGNNVDAHLDADNDNVPDANSRPIGSPARTFDFPANATQSPLTYTNAAVVNLFYWNNWMHDQLYGYGFDEVSGNFQTDNFGRGGQGNDAVIADAQDASVKDHDGYPEPIIYTPLPLNNANFFTPRGDGNAPRMQMYLWDSGPFASKRDGDFDQEIICHEYTHGLSSRLVGAGTGITDVQTAGMGEGWSDFVALSLLSKSTDDVNANYPMGAYVEYFVTNTFARANYYYGIRRYPYAYNMSVNPLTYKDIDPGQYAGHAGVPKNPSFSGTNDTPAEAHEIGEVWCQMLWDCRAQMISRFGFSGNHKMLQLVVTGMKLSESNPTLLQARDAIFEADLVVNGGANHDILWTAFARRGLGYNATSPGANTTSGVVEDYGMPPAYMSVAITSPTEQQILSSSPTVTGKTFTSATQGYTQLQLQRLSDFASYNFKTGGWDATFVSDDLLKITDLPDWSYDLPILPEGKYAINVRAVYQNTYASGYYTRLFRIDPTLPTITFSPLTNNQVVFDLTKVGGHVNKPETVIYRIVEPRADGYERTWNGSSFIITNKEKLFFTAVVSGNNWVPNPAMPLPTRAQTRWGGYILDVRAGDNEDVIVTNQITVIRSADDTSAPDVTIDSIAPNQIITNNFLPGVYGNATDPETGIGNIDIYLMRLVSGDYLYWTGGGWTSTPTALHPTFPAGGGQYTLSSLPGGGNLPNGTYQVQVYAQNLETPPATHGTSVSFTVDYHPVYVWTEGSYVDNIQGNENHRWDNPANWNQFDVPTADSVVVIPGGTCDATMMGSINNIYRVDVGGTGTLQINGLFTKKLNVSGGTLAGGAVNIDGNGGVFNWSGGQINGTYEILAGATLNLFGGTKTLGSGVTLNNAGTINWTNGVVYNYGYYAGDPATINNQSNATFNVYGDGQLFDHQFTPTVFNNLPGALFVKANSFGTSTNGHFTFNNAGEIRVNSGSLLFNNFINLTLQDGSVETGSIICEQSTLNVKGATTIASNNVVVRNATLHGDTNSSITTSGSAELHWSGGTLNGVIEITPNSQFILDTSALKTFDSGAVLRNRGRVYWTDSGNIYNYAYYEGYQARFENLSGAYFYIDTDAAINQDYLRSTFNNRQGATVIKGLGTGTNAIYWQFNNDGLVTCNTGAITFNGGGVSGGEFTANSGTALRFGSGGHTLNNGTLLTGAGRIQIDGDTVTRNGTIYGMPNSPTTLDLISGTFTGVGTLAQQFNVNWTGSTIGGQLIVDSNVVVNVSGSGIKTLGDGAVVNNFGAFNWSGPGTIYNYGYYGGTQSTFINQSNAVFNMIADGDVFKQDYNRSYFTNLNGGLIVKSSGSGTNTMARFVFENFGEIRATSGTVQFTELLNLNEGSKIAGAGNVVLSGTANMNAPLTNTGNIVVDVGNVVGAVSTNGTPLSSYSGTGTFNWIGGSMSGTFVLLANNTIDINGSATKTFSDAAKFENYGTVNWSGTGRLYNYGYFGGTTATFNNHSNAVFNLLSDGQVFNQMYNASTFSNMVGAVVAKKAGTGTNVIDSFTLESAGELRAETGHIQFSGVLNLAHGSTLTGAGAIHFAGNTSLSGTLTGSAASVSFDTGALTGINNATYTGPAPFTWLTGALNGALTIQSGSTMNMAGPADRTMSSGATLNNAGTINWNGPGRIYNYGYYPATDPAKIVNLPNANFNLLTDGEVFVNQYNASSFTNQAGAHFTKLGGTGTNNIHAFTMFNLGDVRSQTGTIQFTEFLDITNGSFSGTGTIQSIGTTTLHGGMDINGPTFKLINGSFTGDVASAANISSHNGGAFEWQTGVLAGTVQVNAGATFNMTGSGLKEFGAGAVLNNAGTMNVGSGTLYNNNYNGNQFATLNNLAGGLIDFTGDATITHIYNPSIINNNAGATFRKSSATTTTSSWTFNNDGTLDLRDGTFVNSALSLGSNGVVNVAFTSTNTNAQLTQNGAIAFTGGLNLVANSLPLTNGLSFTLANYNSSTGAFSPLTLPALPQGSKWKLTYGPTSLTASVVAANVLSSPKKNGNEFQLSLSGEPASAAILQTSFDLNTWTSVSTNAPFTGTFDFDDTPVPGETKKFYRVLIMP